MAGGKIFNRDVRIGGGGKLVVNEVTIVDENGNIDAPVTASSLSTAGTLSVDSTSTLSGKVIEDGTTTTSGAGAVAVTGSIHEVTTTGTGDALTLADGTEGQRLAVVYVAEGAGGDTAVITPTNLAGGSTITLNDLGDTADLIFTAGAWYVLGLGGAAAVA